MFKRVPTQHHLLPEDALLSGEVDLDGGVAPRVVDLASVDLLDGHPAGETADLKGSCTIKTWYVILCSGCRNAVIASAHCNMMLSWCMAITKRMKVCVAAQCLLSNFQT